MEGSSCTETGTPEPSDSRRVSRSHPDGGGKGRRSDRGTGSRDTASGRARAGEKLVSGTSPRALKGSTVKGARLQASRERDSDGLAHAQVYVPRYTC